MSSYVALRFLLGLGIMGATPLIFLDQANAKSLSLIHSDLLNQGTASEHDLGLRTIATRLKFDPSGDPSGDPKLPLVIPQSLVVAPETMNSDDGDPVAVQMVSAPPAVPTTLLPLDSPQGKDSPPDATPPTVWEEPAQEQPSLPRQELLRKQNPPQEPAPWSEQDALPGQDSPQDQGPLPEQRTQQVVPVDPLSTPAERSEVFTQAAFLQQGDETSARLRAGGIYVLSPSVFVGATVDLSTGQAFSDTDATGLSLNELYLTASPANLPELRFSVGLLDLTSYLDRNSFAKDSLTQFFNPVFQTNPALSTTNISSRPAALVNWTPMDELSLTATTYSSRKGLGDFSLDSFAGEVGLRFGHAIVRGTYATSPDSGQGDGFQEIFAIDRGNGQFGPLPGDREESFGLNGEWYIPHLKLGVFGRYGWYTNQDMGVSGQTYSLGLNALDVFLPNDRLGLGYGRQLSNADLRRASGSPVPDVWELFYDAEVIDRLRVGVSVQQRNAWTETVLGFRVRYDLRWTNLIQEGD